MPAIFETNQAMSSKEIEPRQLLLITIAMLLMALVSTQNRGPDQQSYSSWANSLSHAEIPNLTNALQAPREYIWSPSGYPYKPHYPGAGGIQIIPIWIYEICGGSSQEVFQTIFGTFCLVCFLITCFANVPIPSSYLSLTVALALFATPFGLNVLGQGSTAQISLLPTSLAIVELVRFLDNKRVSCFSLAISCAVFLSIRPYLVIYPFAIFVAVILSDLRWMECLRRTLVFSIGLTLGALVYLTTNYLMTGDVMTPPLDFGDSDYSTIDLFRPDFCLNFLFSTHNGLFSIHPLMVFVPFVGVAIAQRIGWSHREGRVVTLLTISIVAHGYIQSCWFYWNMATGFGNRSMVIPALIGVYFCIRYLMLTNYKGLWQSILLACTLYSFLHCLSHQTGYFSWSHLVSEMYFEMLDWTGFELLLGTASLVDALEVSIRPILLVLSGVVAAILTWNKQDQDPMATNWVAWICTTLLFAYSTDRLILMESILGMYLSLATAIAGLVVVFVFKFELGNFRELLRMGCLIFLTLAVAAFAWCYGKAVMNSDPFDGSTDVPYGAWADALQQRKSLTILSQNNRSYRKELEELDAFVNRRIGFLKSEFPPRPGFEKIVDELNTSIGYDDDPTSSDADVLTVPYDATARRKIQKSRLATRWDF